MADHPKMNHKPSREKDQAPRSPMQMPKSRLSARSQTHYVDITAMIRSIQRTEGNTDCFRRGQADCDQVNCAWRQYCLGNAKSVFSDDLD
jgi:hypothetical protein